MDAHRSSYDVIVIGGGPVGSVTALSCAQKGQSVLVLEANPKASHRLAGEWLHPPAYEALLSVGVTDLEKVSWQTGQGFVVYPDDGSEQIVLPYSNQTRGLAIEHADLVKAIRGRVLEQDGIDMLLDARVTAIDGQTVTFKRRRSSSTSQATADLIVGADGRSSIARKSLGLENNHINCGRMAGVLVRDCEVPFPGFGHVILGAPGPVLMYRIGEDIIRMCIDVPVGLPRGRSREAMLWDAYGHVMPEEVRHGFRKALERREVLWAANQIHPRMHFGRDGLMLVGDAVGHYHPMTAAGMTLGFGDALAIANRPDVKTYRRLRSRQSRVPELLAIALYEVFADSSDETVAIRRAIYDLWRAQPRECARTMKFLGCQDTSLVRFGNSFYKTMLIAAQRLLNEGIITREWTHIGRLIGDLGNRAGWLFSGALHLTAAEPSADFQERAKGAYNNALNVSHPKAEILEHPRLKAISQQHSAASDDPRLALIRGVRALTARQRNDGAWEGELGFSAVSAAWYALASRITGHPLSEERRKGILRHFRHTELEDGGWSWSPGETEPASLLATTMVYVAARLLGLRVDDPLATCSQRTIRRLGGAEVIPNIGKLWLAVLGLYGWQGVNKTSPELWSVPAWLPIHPDRYQAHTRQLTQAIAVLSARQPTGSVTAEVEALREEIFLRPWEQVDFNRARRSVRQDECFNGGTRSATFARRALNLMDRVQSDRRRQSSSARLAHDLLHDLRQTGYIGLSPFTAVHTALALWSVDEVQDISHAVLDHFEHWVWEDAIAGVRVPAARSRSWDTAMAMQALTAAAPHLAFDVGSELSRAESWLQDERINNTAMAGWTFDVAAQGLPLSDVTAEATVAQLGLDPLVGDELDAERIAYLSFATPAAPCQTQNIAPEVRRTAHFVLSCQNRDGGFGRLGARTSDVPVEWLSPVELLGNALHERSWIECTGSSCVMLAQIQARLEDSDPLHARIEAALTAARRWMLLQQRPDGSWRGEWGVCFLYGTMFAIRGLVASGTAPQDPAIRKAVAWLMFHQRSDGGWGEHRESAVRDVYIERDESQVVQTAWAMTALLAAEVPDWEVVERAAHFLASRQLETGEWPMEDPVGLAFKTAALDFSLYRTYFPVWALGLYEGRRQRRLQVPEAPGGREPLRVVK